MKKAYMNKSLIKSAAVFVVLGFVACNDEGKVAPVEHGPSIRISADAKAITRGANTLDSLQANGFFLLAIAPGVSGEVNTQFLNTVPESDSIVYGATEETPYVSYQPTDGGWLLSNNPDDEFYWPANHSQKVCFYGWYAGISIDGNRESPMWSNDFVSENEGGAYGVPADVLVTNEWGSVVDSASFAQDLLAVSDTLTLSQSQNGSVQLNFEHVMAQLVFYVRTDGKAEDVRLSDIKFKQPSNGFYNMEKSEWVFTGDFSDWTYLSTEVCGDDDTRRHLTDSYQSVAPAKYGLYGETVPFETRFVFPIETEISVSYQIPVTFNYEERDYLDGQTSFTKTATVKLEAGKVNNVYLTLPTDETNMIVTVNTTFIDWIQ
ncbi:MAG: fimbrillin family protein [Bacteroidales bacterium]|nr:fimbrillin family protein [Bacteroidales bacterium]